MLSASRRATESRRTSITSSDRMIRRSTRSRWKCCAASTRGSSRESCRASACPIKQNGAPLAVGAPFRVPIRLPLRSELHSSCCDWLGREADREHRNREHAVKPDVSSAKWYETEARRRKESHASENDVDDSADGEEGLRSAP